MNDQKTLTEELKILSSLSKLLSSSSSSSVEEVEEKEEEEESFVHRLDSFCSQYPDSFFILSLQSHRRSSTENNNKNNENKSLRCLTFSFYFRLLEKELDKFYTRCCMQEVEQGYFCPITQELLDYPVILNETGHSYEEKALKKWFRQKKREKKKIICPVSAQVLRSLEFSKNSHLRSNIVNYKGKFVRLTMFFVELIHKFIKDDDNNNNSGFNTEELKREETLKLVMKCLKKSLLFCSEKNVKVMEMYLFFSEYSEKIGLKLEEKVENKKSIIQKLISYYLKQKNYKKILQFSSKLLQKKDLEEKEKNRFENLILESLEKLQDFEELTKTVLEFSEKKKKKKEKIKFLTDYSRKFPKNNQYLIKLCENHPSNTIKSQLHCQIAENYQDSGIIEKAMEHFHLATEKDENNIHSWEKLKDLTIDKKEKLLLIEKLCKLYSTHSKFKERKKKNLEEGLKLKPDSILFKQMKCEMCIEEGNFFEIIKITQEEGESDLSKLRKECLFKLFNETKNEILGLRQQIINQTEKQIILEEEVFQIKERLNMKSSGKFSFSKKSKKKKQKEKSKKEDTQPLFEVNLGEKKKIPKFENKTPDSPSDELDVLLNVSGKFNQSGDFDLSQLELDFEEDFEAEFEL